MALLAVLTAEEFSKLPTAIKEHYREDNGSHILDVTSAGDLELANVVKLKSGLQKEREKTEKLEKAFKPFKDLDPEKVQDALSKMDELATWDPDKKLAEARKQMEKQLSDSFASKEKQLTDKYSSELGGVTKKYEATKGQLHHTLVDAQLIAAISSEKGIPDLLVPALRSHIKMVENEDGTWDARVIDKEGTERLSSKSGAGSSDRMSIAELVQEMKRSQTFARAFDGNGTGGSGSTGGDSRPSGGSFRISETDARDPMKYRKMREEANKAGKPLEIVGT